MTKTLKQLVHVLWAIEKDLHAIASNTGANDKYSQMREVSKQNTDKSDTSD